MYVLNRGDINNARRELGLDSSKRTVYSSSNSNYSTVASSNSSYTVILVIAGIIIFFFIVRRIGNYNERMRYESAVKKQEEEKELALQKQKREEEERVKNNLNWLKHIESGICVYSNTKYYITERKWEAFSDKFSFLKITQLYRVISPDETMMKPYLKCSVYGFNDSYTMVLRTKVTGLESEAKIFYSQNKADSQDLHQIKSYFEPDEAKRTTHENNSILPPDMIDFYRAFLGLKLRFTQAELKTAFREAATKCHPDLYGASQSRDRENAEKLMKLTNDAYDALKRVAI